MKDLPDHEEPFVDDDLSDDIAADPYEINFLPEFLKGRGPRQPFVNRYGVIIGDHIYESEQSPLHNWSKDTDPAQMSGDEWVHPFKDIGFHSAENKQYFEQGIEPQSGIFTHPDKDVAYEAYNEEVGGTLSEDAKDQSQVKRKKQ